MSIAIEFPDGSKKEFDDGVLVLDVAKSISTSLGKKAVAGKFNGELVDLQRPLKQDGKLQILTAADVDRFKRYSCFLISCYFKRSLSKNALW